MRGEAAAVERTCELGGEKNAGRPCCAPLVEKHSFAGSPKYDGLGLGACPSQLVRGGGVRTSGTEGGAGCATEVAFRGTERTEGVATGRG